MEYHSGTEPHTHRILNRIWSTSFRLVVTWLTERTYVRTHASRDCTGGIGETIKREGGVSQACLGKSTSCILDICKMVNWQLSKPDRHWPVLHDHFAGSCVNSSRWRDLFGSCQCCDQLTAVKTGYPLTSITWSYRGLRCRPIELKYFLKLSADKLVVFKWSQAQVSFFLNSYEIGCVFVPHN